MGVAGESGLRRALRTLTEDGASPLPSLADESTRSGGGRAGARGFLDGSNGGLEAPGLEEKLPEARICCRVDGTGGGGGGGGGGGCGCGCGACPACIVAGCAALLHVDSGRMAGGWLASDRSRGQAAAAIG